MGSGNMQGTEVVSNKKKQVVIKWDNVPSFLFKV